MSKASLIELEDESTNECKSNKNSDHRKTEFLGEIVSASTFAPPGSEIDTSLRCRKRPERKQCHGLIRVHLQEEPVELRWWCPVCGDRGVINNWKGIPWKKNHIKSIHGNKNNEFCEIILPLKDFELLKQISILEPIAENIVQNAMQISDGMILSGTVDAIDTLIGYIAFEANHEQKPRRQQLLNKLFDKICSVLKGRW
jgi:hypothetical protein